MQPLGFENYARVRFYDSENGRMMEPDPVWNGINPYLYCHNDPVNFTDPDGRVPLAGAMVLGGVLGFVEGKRQDSPGERKCPGPENPGPGI